MSAIVLTSETLIGTPAPGNIEYNGQFFGTDSASSRAQMQRLVLSTAKVTTSGTSIDFTGIPAWVERITVMCIGVSQNSAGQTIILQIGAGSVTTSGYSSSNAFIAPSTDSGSLTTGFPITRGVGAAAAFHGIATICAFGSNSWVFSSTMADAPTQGQVHFGAGSVALGGTLDRVRLTTIGGTATFDAGSVNIIYEG
jgi:hypothetical protein